MADPAGVPPDLSKQKLQELIDRAQKGDRSTEPQIQQLLDNPLFAGSLADGLTHLAQATLIEKFCGQNVLMVEVLRRKLDHLQTELVRPNAPPLERLLVECVVACWLHLQHLEYRYAQEQGMGPQQVEHFQRCISAAQKRYLGAIKSLALVRKLALPTVQVNIGETG